MKVPILLGLAISTVIPAWAAAPMPPKSTRAPTHEELPAGARLKALEIMPAELSLNGCYDGAQLIVTGVLASGDRVDVTRMVSLSVDEPVVEVTPGGFVNPKSKGNTRLNASLNGKTASVPVHVADYSPDQKVDFIRDVNPVIAHLGCNAGSCHGSKEGKVGFKLSLRGYDPIFDVRSLVDDHAGRRVNFASPDDSLMLLKATGAVPHEGGQRTKFEDKYYRILRTWIADGGKLDTATPKVSKIEVLPINPIMQVVGSRQQMRIVATYADGMRRDVTAEAFIDSGNVDVATAEKGGIVTTLRRGEAPILARYEGNYAATIVTVMGNRSGFEWREPEKWNKIDDFVAAKWKRMKIAPSGLCSDDAFLRRVTLDLTGLPPTAEDVRAFLADQRPTRVKRDALIDRLIGNPDYVDHWSNKWADLLQVNRKFLGEDGARLFRDWIRHEVDANTPYDQFVRKVLTASGSNRENPAASYYKVLRTPTEAMENTTHLFLATRFNCNKCHDHPFERWTQDQYYELSAYFARIDLKKDPASGKKTIAGTAVDDAKPIYEIVSDATEGDVRHDRTGQITPPEFPYPSHCSTPDHEPTRREQLAAWLTSPDNRYFALSYVNRMWGYLMGVGLIDPLDDIRAGNPPSNPELLQWLTRQFVESGFDVRKLQSLIAKSRTYQLSIASNQWNSDDKTNYSHAMARRLPAEVLFDAVLKVTGSTPQFPGVKPGTRAAQLPDSAIDVPSGFLASLGRPARESACECERSSDIRLGSVMALLSGPAVSGAISDPTNDLAKLTGRLSEDQKLVDEIFLRTLSRHATPEETQATLASWNALDDENRKLSQDLVEREKWWAPIFEQKARERESAIAQARTSVAERTGEIAGQVAAAEQKRQEKIAEATAALADYESSLPEKQAAWERTLDDCQLSTTWIPFVAETLKGAGGYTVKKGPNNTYIATGPSSGTDYTLTAETDLAKITGVLVEVLTDDSLPSFGPGRHQGQFVMSEITLKWRRSEGEREDVESKFRAARADYSDPKHPVTEAIDGKGEAGVDGWSIGDRVGEPHYARFALAEPVGDGTKIEISIMLQQRFKENYNFGRFRVWLTTSPEPLELGLPADISPIARLAASTRTPEQAKAIADHFRELDVGLIRKRQAVYTAERPLPRDPLLLEREALLARAELPVVIDPTLVRLRADAEMSHRQIEVHRLTAAQDLVWALVNTPAFLFNH